LITMGAPSDRLNEIKASIGYYDVLEVSPRATREVIQAAYRTLARASHPDLNPGADAAERMLELNRAYEVLSDPAQRAKYDIQCARATRRAQPAVVHPAQLSVAAAKRVEFIGGQAVEGPDRRAFFVLLSVVVVIVLVASVLLGVAALVGGGDEVLFSSMVGSPPPSAFVIAAR
jgi:hypothetical protein